jgi:putative membrane protein
MKALSEQDRARVEAAVRAAEARTSGEIVVSVVDASDAYPHVPLAGAIIGLLTALLAWLLSPAAWQPLPVAASLLGGLVLGFTLAQWVRPIKRFLLGSRVAETEVYQRALQGFVESGVAETRDRTGILIFVSLLERRVQVIADAGIHRQVADRTWDEVVGLTLDGIRRGSLADGLCAAVARCGELLAREFPRREDDKDELSDQPIVEPR